MTTTHITSRIDHVLEAARARLNRLNADEVPEALRNGAYLVDIRPAAQRAAEGQVPDALVIERNVLQWIILCSQGYTSSLAAAALQDLGLHRATDVIGGYQALAAVGELVEPAPLAALSVGVQQGAESFSLLRGPRRWM